MRSLQLRPFNKSNSKHGGETRRGKRKIARPITAKTPMHLVMRSSKAKGAWSMLSSPRRRFEVAEVIESTANKFDVHLYKFENVGNHLHLLVQARCRRDLQNFLRVLPQRIMFLVTGACKGNAKGKFWDKPAFTRIVEWGRDFLNMRRYLAKNKLESLGLSRTMLDRESFVFRYKELGRETLSNLMIRQLNQRS